jgi:hypothetical protein
MILNLASNAADLRAFVIVRAVVGQAQMERSVAPGCASCG